MPVRKRHAGRWDLACNCEIIKNSDRSLKMTPKTHGPSDFVIVEFSSISELENPSIVGTLCDEVHERN